MGRVHKKKIAQYNKENGEGKDGTLDNSTNGDEKSSDRSRAESDADESIASLRKRTPKSTPVVDGGKDDDGEPEQIDDIDRSDKKNDSEDDKDPEPEVNKSTPIGKKGAQKRKAPSRSKTDADDEDENSDANDVSPNKKAALKKNAGKKPKAKPKSKKSKTETEDEAENDEEDNEDNDDQDLEKEDDSEKSASPVNKKGAAAKKSPAKKGKAKPKSKKQKNDTDDKTDDEGEVDEEEEQDEDAEQEYEVKDVVDHKIEKGISYYLIRWKGYGPNDDTWEEESTLSCQNLIDKFNNKKKNSTKSTKSKPSPKRAASKTASGKKDGDDPEKEWEVDKIIDYSDEKKGRVFRIRWKGYSAKFDTWEPEEHLNCDELIQKFLKKVDSQKDISFKELREEPKKTKRMVSEGFLKAEKGARKSKRGTGKQRIQYADSD